MKDVMNAGDAKGMIREVVRNRTKLKRSVGQLKRHMKEKLGDKKDLESLLEDVSNWYAEDGMKATKNILEKQYGFSKNDIDKGLVWVPGDGKGRKPEVHIRGSIKDSLDYEFYGVPNGVFPNVTRLRNWVRTRVILRDAGLRTEYQKPGTKHKTQTLDELTFLFGRAIARDGLKRRSTTRYEQTQDPKLIEKGISVTYKGKHVPVKQLTRKESLSEGDNIKWP